MKLEQACDRYIDNLTESVFVNQAFTSQSTVSFPELLTNISIVEKKKETIVVRDVTQRPFWYQSFVVGGASACVREASCILFFSFSLSARL